MIQVASSQGSPHVQTTASDWKLDEVWEQGCDWPVHVWDRLIVSFPECLYVDLIGFLAEALEVFVSLLMVLLLSQCLPL